MIKTGLDEIWAVPGMSAYIDQIDRALVRTISTQNSGIARPALVLIKDGGKRLRPRLTFSIAKSSSKSFNSQDVVRAGVAIELVHLGSVVHDDVIDKSKTRRGGNSVQSNTGVSQAILIGDYLLAAAQYQAAQINPDAVELIASTIQDMTDGQSRELTSTYSLDRSLKNYQSTIKYKTAALFKTACNLGLYALDCQPKTTMAGTFGESFGMAFQMIDDLQDIAEDVENGVYTLPILLALSGDQGERLREYLEQRPAPMAKINKILLSCGAINQTGIEIKKNITRATKNLEVFGELQHFPQQYLDWAIKSRSN